MERLISSQSTRAGILNLATVAKISGGLKYPVQTELRLHFPPATSLHGTTFCSRRFSGPKQI